MEHECCLKCDVLREAHVTWTVGTCDSNNFMIVLYNESYNVCSGALPDGSRWLHVEPRERTTGGGDNNAECSWQETKLLSGVFVRSFIHHSVSWSLHHAVSQLTHEFGTVALNILRYRVRMRTGLFHCLKIQALTDMAPFLLSNSAFQSSLLPPCARSKQPCLGLLRLKMEAARRSVLW